MAAMAALLIWASSVSGHSIQYVFIAAPTAIGPFGDYPPAGPKEKEGNLIRDVLACGFERIEIVSNSRATDGGIFAVRVRKDHWLDAAMPCLKKKLPQGFKITDDRTMED